MEQYRITSADFVTPGDQGEQDAFIDPDELKQLKSLSGLSGLLDSAINRTITPPKILKEVKYDGI